MTKKLDGKIALVTGASKGIGAAIARQLAAEGADAITLSLSKELGPRKIRVNSVNPGMVITEGLHTAGMIGSDMHKQIEAQTPLGRVGQPEDIAGAVVYFASSDSSWVTGECLVLAGGIR